MKDWLLILTIVTFALILEAVGFFILFSHIKKNTAAIGKNAMKIYKNKTKIKNKIKDEPKE